MYKRQEYNRVIGNFEVEPLIAIPVFIHDFLCIHPFNDGNGRMSRLLTTLMLYQNGFYVGKYISLEAKIAKNKDLYYSCLLYTSTFDCSRPIGTNKGILSVRSDNSTIVDGNYSTYNGMRVAFLNGSSRDKELSLIHIFIHERKRNSKIFS